MRHSIFITLTLVACATASELYALDSQEFRDVVRAEVESQLGEMKFDTVKSAGKSAVKKAASAGVVAANAAVDQAQSDLDIYGEDDAGVWNVIPADVRNQTEWMVNLAKDPVNKLVDAKQTEVTADINEQLNTLV